MCGICGYISDKRISVETLQEMNDTMYYRGPNDSGTWEGWFSCGAVGLAQRRLSILDLSPLGHQPMFSCDKKFVTVYNGEIYNYMELRRELECIGYHFCSGCDTEVMIAAYQEWGCGCFARFNGMFAIALFERESGKLILARDRMGKKPLYYYRKGKDFVFASELKPIMRFPRFEKRISLPMIEKLLCSKYIEAPFSIFENTYKMVPGTYLILEKGQINIQSYWDIKEKKDYGTKHSLDYHEALDQMDTLLQDAVKSRLVADVPVGTFLSGGIDSTLITAVAQKISNSSIKSFSIGFWDKERNEAAYAAEIADYIGTRHKELYIGDNETLEMLQDMPFYYDEPFSDASQLPAMLVSKLASEDITVALSGDGGDELYCGYKMYDWVYIAQKVDWLGAIAAAAPGIKAAKSKLSPELRAFLDNRNEDYKTQLFLDVMIEEADKLLGVVGRGIKYTYEKNLKFQNWQERRMLLDMMTYLPDEVLAKTDRASMKYSLEVRCPLLDYRLVEQSFAIPHKYKYTMWKKKYILKELVYRYVPKQLVDRPKKGFGVPLCKWLRTVLKAEVARYADVALLKKQDIFMPEAVVELTRKQEKSNKIIYSSMLWSFYVFQRWYQYYIDDLWK